MTTKDKGQNLEKYVLSARTALYSHHASPKSMLTGEVLTHIKATRPRAMKAWQEKIHNINQNDIISAIQKVPGTMMTDISKEFTLALIQINQKSILK